MRWRFRRPGRRRPGSGSDGRPLLAVDVDGVVSLFGYEDDRPDPAGVAYDLIGGKLHCLSLAGGERLRRLGEFFDLIWVSGWEGRTRALSPLLGLAEIPYLRFGGKAEFGSANWKLERLGKYSSGRALAWIDDSFDERCYEWARERSDPTLLVGVESATGLLDVHVEALIGWARSLRVEEDSGEP